MNHSLQSQAQKRINIFSGAKGDIAALLAGVLAVFSFAPFGFFFLIVVSLSLLVATWIDTSAGRAFRRGFLYGCGMFGFGVYWLHISIHEFGNTGFIPAILLTFLLVAYMSLYSALVGYLYARFCKREHIILSALFVASAWVWSEWLRNWIMTGFPWLNIGYTQIDTWFGGFAPVTGNFGTGFFIVLSSMLILTLLWTNTRQRIINLVLLAVITISAVVLDGINWTQPKGKPLNVALIQGNIGQTMKWRPEQQIATMNLYAQLTAQHLDADIVLWPETAIPTLYHQVADTFLFELQQKARATNTDLLIGIPYLDMATQRYYNSIVALNSTTEFYHKRHLVPFGEFIPLKNIIGSVLGFLQIPMSDFSSGEQEKPLLPVANNMAGISICYEDVFGEEVIEALPEASLLVNVSNDAWFGDSLAPHQHLQMARMRSLETGRPMLRATNTGMSAVINDRGDITAQSPQFQQHVLRATIQPMQGMTPYAYWGNWFIVSVSLLLLLFTFWKNRQV